MEDGADKRELEGKVRVSSSQQLYSLFLHRFRIVANGIIWSCNFKKEVHY